MMSYTKNEIVTLTITDIGTDGEGIGKLDGFPFFVKDALPGDVVEARVTKTKKTYAYARLEKILTPSADRVEPRCKDHKRCGGCQIQALGYDAQLRFKQEKVRGNLIRIGGFDAEFVDSVMEPIVGMDEETIYRYRNKAQFPIGIDKFGKPIAGFYAGRTHDIIENTDCVLGVEENRPILECVLSHMEQYEIKAYDEESGNGLIRHVLIRKGFASGQLLVCLILNCKGDIPGILHLEELCDKLETIPGMTSISVNYNPAKTNVILGPDTVTVRGEGTIEDEIALYDVSEDGKTFAKNDTRVRYKISPQSFYQVNPAQTSKLYSLALSFAGLTGKESVWDLYCGIGTISLFMAGKAENIYGIEVVPQAINDARANARLNHIINAQFFVGKAEEVLPQFYDNAFTEEQMAMRHPDVIVVDPPRKGCDPDCLDTMIKMHPERIVYVSCDSATLARDLKILCDAGYQLKRVRPVDQFPHTVHVEVACALSLK